MEGRDIFTDPQAISAAKLSAATSDLGLKRLFEHRASEQLERLITQDGKRQKISVHTVLTGTQKDHLQSLYPELDLQFTGRSATDHGPAAAAREVIQDKLLRTLNPFTRAIDVGGNYAVYVRKNISNVHSCSPCIEGRDSMRQTYRNCVLNDYQLTVAVKGTAEQKNFMNQYLKNPTEIHCNNLAEDCRIQATTAFFINSAYDIPVHNVAKIMAAHGCSIGHSAMIFSPEMCLVGKSSSASGEIPDLECMWQVYEVPLTIPGLSKNSLLRRRMIKFTFRNASSLDYEHDFENYFRMATQSTFDCVYEGVPHRYGAERSYKGGHILTKLVKMAAHLPNTTKLSYSYWRESLRNKVAIRVYDYNGIAAGERIEHMVPEIVFMDKNLYNKTLGYALRTPDSSFTPDHLFSFAFSANYKLTVNGVEVTVQDHMDTTKLYKLVHSLFFICFQLKYSQRITNDTFLHRELNRRSLKSAGLSELVWTYMTGNYAKSPSLINRCLNQVRERVAARVARKQVAAPGLAEDEPLMFEMSEEFEQLDCLPDYDNGSYGEYRKLVDAVNRVAEPQTLQSAADDLAGWLRHSDHKSAQTTQLRTALIDILRRLVVICPSRYSDFCKEWSNNEVVNRILDGVTKSPDIPSLIGGAKRLSIYKDLGHVADHVAKNKMDVLPTKGDGKCGAYALAQCLRYRNAPNADDATIVEQCQRVSGGEDWFEDRVLNIVAKSYGYDLCLLYIGPTDSTYAVWSNTHQWQSHDLKGCLFIANEQSAHYESLIPGTTDWDVVEPRPNNSNLHHLQSYHTVDYSTAFPLPSNFKLMDVDPITGKVVSENVNLQIHQLEKPQSYKQSNCATRSHNLKRYKELFNKNNQHQDGTVSEGGHDHRRDAPIMMTDIRATFSDPGGEERLGVDVRDSTSLNADETDEESTSIVEFNTDGPIVEPRSHKRSIESTDSSCFDLDKLSFTDVGAIKVDELTSDGLKTKISPSYSEPADGSDRAMSMQGERADHTNQGTVTPNTYDNVEEADLSNISLPISILTDTTIDLNDDNKGVKYADYDPPSVHPCEELNSSAKVLRELMGSPVYKGLSPDIEYLNRINVLAVLRNVSIVLTNCFLYFVVIIHFIFYIADRKNMSSFDAAVAFLSVIITSVTLYLQIRSPICGLFKGRYGKVTESVSLLNHAEAVHVLVGGYCIFSLFVRYWTGKSLVVPEPIMIPPPLLVPNQINLSFSKLTPKPSFSFAIERSFEIFKKDLTTAFGNQFDYYLYEPTKIFTKYVVGLFESSREEWTEWDTSGMGLVIAVVCLTTLHFWVGRLATYKFAPSVDVKLLLVCAIFTSMFFGHFFLTVKLITVTLFVTVPRLLWFLFMNYYIRYLFTIYAFFRASKTVRDSGHYRSFNVWRDEKITKISEGYESYFQGSIMKLPKLIETVVAASSWQETLSKASAGGIVNTTCTTGNGPSLQTMHNIATVRNDLLRSHYTYVREAVRNTEGQLRSQYKDVVRYNDIRVKNSRSSKPIGNFEILKKKGPRLFEPPSFGTENLFCAFDPNLKLALTGEQIDGGLVHATILDGLVKVDADTDKLYVSDVTRDCLAFMMESALIDQFVQEVKPERTFILVDGVPGNGKTTELISKMEEGDAVAITTKLAAKDAEMKAMAKGKSGKNIKTIASRIINQNYDCKTGRLLVDEGLMASPGELLFLAEKMNATTVIVFGDSVQIPFIPRVPGFVVPHMNGHIANLGWRVETRSVTHRCPKDVAVAIRPYYQQGVWTTSKVCKSVEVAIIKSEADVRRYSGRKIITFTQAMKDKLVRIGMKETNTINEVQGQTFEDVVVVRTEPNLDDALRLSVGQAVVAITRHTKSLVYATFQQIPKNRDKLMDMIDSALRLDDVERIHGQPPPNQRLIGGAKNDDRVLTEELDRRLTEKFLVAHGAHSHDVDFYAPGYDTLRHRKILFPTSYNVIPVFKCPDPKNTIQTVLDVVFPGNSTTDPEFDSSMIQYSDMNFNITADVAINLTKHDEKLKPRNTFEPVLRTGIGPPRQPTQRGLMLSLNKRNFGGSTVSLPQDAALFAKQAMDKMMDTFCVPDWRDQIAAMEPVVMTEPAFKEWLQLQTYSTKLAADKVDRFLTADEIKHMVSEYSIIMKAMPKISVDMKVQTMYAAVQTIMFHKKDVNAFFGPMMRVVDKRFLSLLKPNVMMNKRKSHKDIEEFLNTDCSDPAGMCYPFVDAPNGRTFKSFECDFSDYDRCQKEVAFHLDRELITRMGVMLEDMDVWSNGHYTSTNFSIQQGIRAYLRFQRKSGDVTTSLGNTVLNMAVLAWCLDLNSTEWKLAMFLGDDSWVSVLSNPETDAKVKQFSKRAAEFFGLEAKAGFFKTGYFCGLSLCETINGIRILSDPFRRAIKLGRGDIKNDKEFHEHWESFKDVLRNYDDMHNLECLGEAMEERIPRATQGLVVELCAALHSLKKSKAEFIRMWSKEKTLTHY